MYIILLLLSLMLVIYSGIRPFPMVLVLCAVAPLGTAIPVNAPGIETIPLVHLVSGAIAVTFLPRLLLNSRPRVAAGKVGVLFAAFCFAALASALLSPHSGEAVRVSLLRCFSALVIYLIVFSSVRTESQLKKLIKVLLSVAVFSAVYGIYPRIMREHT